MSDAGTGPHGVSTHQPTPGEETARFICRLVDQYRGESDG